MSRRPKKRRSVFEQDIVPDSLVDPRNPPHRHQACTTAHPTRAHHRMVTLAARPSSRSTSHPSQEENVTVMLISMEPAEFANEDDFQRLLARFPELLVG